MSAENPNKSLVDFKTRAWQSRAMVQTYLKSTEKKPLEESLFNFMSDAYLQHIQKEWKVLDVGCGTGRLTIALHEFGCRAVGSDVSQAMLDALLEKRPEIETICADGRSIPVEDGSFDAVVSMDYMPHFPDWPDLLKEKARICRPDGLVIFNFQSREHAAVARDTGRHEYNHLYSADPESPAEKFLAEYSAQELLDACAAAGLKLERLHPYGFFWPHYNHMIGYSLGQEGAEQYQERLGEMMQNPEVREFAYWLEKNLIRNLPAFLSHEHVTVCRKL